MSQIRLPTLVLPPQRPINSLLASPSPGNSTASTTFPHSRSAPPLSAPAQRGRRHPVPHKPSNPYQILAHCTYSPRPRASSKKPASHAFPPASGYRAQATDSVTMGDIWGGFRTVRVKGVAVIVDGDTWVWECYE